MENFLYNVALHLWGIYGEEIGSLTILLPNNRSRIFFVDALSKIAGKPIFGPRFISIDSLMCELAQIGRLDHIRTITELYHIYSQEHHEEFDSFYHWGEVLLSDFDAVDKYLIDADMLFTNLSDLKDMDGDLSYLSAEQVAAIRRFWESFDVEEEQSEHQKKFLTIWNSLLTIYNNFRSRLSDMGYGYAGMIYRRAAERLKAGEVELPEGESWGFPSADNSYPFAAFHYPRPQSEESEPAVGGDTPVAGGDENFTLCFEDRDGEQGLNHYYTARYNEEALSQRITLALRLDIGQMGELFSPESQMSLLSLYRIAVGGESIIARIDAVESYDAESQVAVIRFIRLLRDE